MKKWFFNKIKSFKNFQIDSIFGQTIIFRGRGSSSAEELLV